MMIPAEFYDSGKVSWFWGGVARTCGIINMRNWRDLFDFANYSDDADIVESSLTVMPMIRVSPVSRGTRIFRSRMAETAMRTGHACVLAMVLFGSTPAWGQMNPTGRDPSASPLGPRTSSALFDGDFANASDGKIVPAQATRTEPSMPTSVLFNRDVPNDEPDTLGANASPQRLWLRTDFLLWYIRKTAVPPLIQTIPDSLANQNNPPANAATNLFPNTNQLGYKVFDGLRVNAGMWFDSTQRIGIDVSGFVLEQNANGAGFVSTGSPVLLRTYNNVNNGQPTLLQFSNPDPVAGYSGSLSANSVVSTLLSGDLNVRVSSYRIFSDHTDFLFGARYLDFREHLDINGTASLKDGRTLAVSDHFAVTNQFYGGQAGLHGRWNGMYGFSLDGVFKLAMGGVAERININGSNTLTSAAGVPSTQPVGLYAQPSNSGTFTNNVFAVIPDLTLNLNYSFNERAAIFVGYNFLYVSSIARVGSVINPNVNDSNLRYISNPTPGNNPGSIFSVRNDGMWVQGINMGLRLEF